jgi:hypothetical protein
LLVLIQGGAVGAFNPNTDGSLVGHWKLDDGSGTIAEDSSPNANHGTLQGDPQWVTGWLGGALEFDGAADYVDTGYTEDLAAWTVSAWVTSPAAPSGDSPSGPVHRESNYQINWNHSDTVYQAAIATNAGGWNAASYGPVDADTWYFITGTYDGEELKAYRNGELITTNSAPSGPASAEGNSLKFGRHAAADQFFAGTVDDVRVYNRALTDEEILFVMQGGLDPGAASAPVPDNEATDVPRDTVLSWTPGEFAATHDVYLGTSFDDVNDASRTNPMGVLASQGQTATTYDPGRLEFGQTYFWRVDEVNAAPDNTIFTGEVWRFEVEPFAYAIANVIATSNGESDETSGPEKLVDGSGLNEADQHSVDAYDMWSADAPADGSDLYLQFEFDAVYKLHQILVWNYNVQFEMMLGFGLKNVTVEYSTDGEEWTVLGDYDLNQATARATYVYNSVIDFGGIPAKYVKLTVNSAFGTLGYGLSEVRFTHIPVQAREPQPADGAVNVDTDAVLSWRAGREAATHEVYFGVDAEELPLLGTSAQPSIAPGVLDLATTYYWKVVEVNDLEAIGAWEGSLWSFATRAFTVVEDFESYTDDIEAGEAIFDTWLDGWVNDTGSTVGHMVAPFAEQSIVHSGRQSMPMFYENTNGLTIAEAERTFPAQNWTASGIKTLSLYFYGDPGNTGQLYLKINGTKVPYDGDAADITRGAWQPWNVDLSTVGINLSSVTKLTIGIEGAGAEGIVYIDDIRLYPTEPEFVTPVEPDTVGLVARYAFDGNVNDSSGNGFHGTVEGNATYTAGVDGQAITLDGLRTYVVVETVGITGDAPRTISGWAKADTTTIPAWTNIFGFTGPGTNGQHFDIEAVGDSGANATLGYYGLHRHGWERNILPIDLEWHHLAATFDGTTVKWYGDGMLIGSDEADNVNTPGPFHIGKRQDNEEFFPGAVDEVRVYDRALSDGEIAWLAGRTVPLHKAF